MVHELARNVVHDLYAACRVVAVPSRFESFSIAAIEAMASARPVVCTSRVGAAELIEGSGGGTVTPPEDPDSFAAALRPYLLDPHLATTTGEAAREIALRHCHPSTIAAQREACYLQAIDLRRASD
jgi:glycosyltransferase involved in cell wall biosynthesis